MAQFNGEVAIVTGGNSGIGAATAKLFASEGAQVVVAARNEERGNQTVRDIVSIGGKATFIKTDLSHQHEIENCVIRTIEIYGGIDIVFNNAGIGAMGGWSESENSWNDMLETTVTALFHMCKLVIPHMQAKGDGSIVNMSSIKAVQGNLPNQHPLSGLALSYHASKGAVESYTRALAVELGHFGIRVNCVRPGWIETPLTGKGRRRTEEVTKPYYRGRQALDTTGQPEDIAQAVVFLSSSDARFITGQILSVDGGVTLT